MYLNTRSTSKTTQTDLISSNETDLTRRIKFGTLLFLQIPSILCYLFLLFHLLFKRSMRRSLNNHVFIVLLFIGLIWNFLDLFLYSLTNVLILWASIERHILIFHKSILNTQRKRFIIHYLPLIIPPPLYLLLVYILITFVHPCKTIFDYTQVVFGGLYYSDISPWLDTTDRFIHDVIPAFLIGVSSILLIGRVIWQKHYCMRLPMQWHRHRKLAIQIIPISILYLCCVIPYGLITCINIFDGWSGIGMDVQQLYFFYLFYLLAELLPFAYLAAIPKLYSKLFCRHPIRIIPETHPRNRY